jgi:hypothetical protein
MTIWKNYLRKFDLYYDILSVRSPAVNNQLLAEQNCTNHCNEDDDESGQDQGPFSSPELGLFLDVGGCLDEDGRLLFEHFSPLEQLIKAVATV